MVEIIVEIAAITSSYSFVSAQKLQKIHKNLYLESYNGNFENLLKAYFTTDVFTGFSEIFGRPVCQILCGQAPPTIRSFFLPTMIHLIISVLNENSC